MSGQFASYFASWRSLAPGIACALAMVAGGGCGGSGGVRALRAEPPEAGAADVVVQTPFVCGTANSLDCTRPFTLMPDGHVTDFGPLEYTSSSGKWCDASGFHGSTFSFKGSGANDTSAISVDTADGSMKLALMVTAGSYGGGGMAFESCLDATAFTGVRFSVAVSSGSLTGCTYQLQLQTFEQRPTSQSPPGACDINTTTCYSFPAARNLPDPSTDPTKPTLVSVPFSAFTGVSTTPPPAQLVGLQWQVNSSGPACTVELRIDDVDFIPAAAPASDAGID